MALKVIRERALLPLPVLYGERVGVRGGHLLCQTVRGVAKGQFRKSRNDRSADAMYSCNTLRWLVVAHRAGRSLRSSQGAVAIPCVSQPCVPTSVEHVLPSRGVPRRIGIFRTYPQRLVTWSYSDGCPNRVANVVTMGLAGFCVQRGSLVSIDQVHSLAGR